MKSTNHNLANFVSEMRKQDEHRRRMHFSMALSSFPMSLFFIIFGMKGHPGMGLLGFGFLLAISYLVIVANSYGKSDYSVPVAVYLKKAMQRYRFWTIRRALVPVPIFLIMGYAGGWIVWLSAVKYFESRGVAIAMGIYSIFFVGLCAFAIIIEWKKWLKEGAPLLRSIRSHLGQLEEE